MRFLLALTLTMVAPVLATQTPAQAPNVTTAPRGNVENGKKVYTAYGCYQCHNYAANGGGAGPRLAPRPIPFPAFSRYIRQPRGQMPPYTPKVVTEQELADIYAFLLTIPVPRPVDGISILDN